MSELYGEAKKLIKQQGGRMTTQRRLILETLEELGSHPTAEEIFHQARKEDPTLNLSTVYRTLRWLESENLINTRMFDGERRQERFDTALPGEHYHFVCTSCQQVIEFDTMLVNAIKAQFELHSGAHVDVGSVVLYGQCADCRNLPSKR